jgi:hypothetical protein
MGGTNGKEEPCVPTPTLLKIQKGGRTCPRYEIADGDEVIAELAMLGAKLGADHPLFDKLFDLHTEEWPREERLALFYRIVDIVSDSLISAKIKAARERSSKANT